ncbi:PQQ-binding-like beta-propeller repeat protein [Streptomyces sp. NPDC006658]|uniref:caspase, EACC1-associated type n=1 Tax=Streptomyces sp. NPDC006658 TaxID=3156900 RepID=UPI0033F3F5D3
MSLLPDPDRSVALLVGVHTYAHLDDLPAVSGNLKGLREALTDAEVWGLPADRCTVLSQPDSAGQVLDAVRRSVERAEDTLFVYYAGHGLTDPYTDELYLALPDSDREREYTALRYEYLRRAVLDPAGGVRRTVVVLDCCYSGRALVGRMSASDHVADHAMVEGTCLLTASAETRTALSPPGEPYTAFTGELISALVKGIPGAPDPIDMDSLYRHLYRTLAAKARPLPQQRNRNTGGLIALGRNRAAAPPAPPPGPSRLRPTPDTAPEPRSASASEEAPSPAPPHEADPESGTISENPYDSDLWRDIEDEGIGVHPSRDVEDQGAGPRPPGTPSARPAGLVSRRQALIGLTGMGVAGIAYAATKIADSKGDKASPNVSPSKSSAPPEKVNYASGEKRWLFPTDDSMISPPLLSGQRVYVSCGDGFLYALHAATGKLAWKFDTEDYSPSAPALDNGLLYVGAGRELRAVDVTTGKQRWKHPTDESISSLTAARGTVFASCPDGIHTLYAIDATEGRRRWQFTTAASKSSPIVADGTVYIGSADHHLYAIDAATGKQRWSYGAGESADTSPVVAGDTVYIASGTVLHAVDVRTGNQRWKIRTESKWPPAVADGTVYFGDDHGLHAVDAATGEQKWKYKAVAAEGEPAVARGSVYFGGGYDGSNETLYAIDTKTGNQRWVFHVRKSFETPRAANGIVCFGIDGGLIAVNA